MCADGDTLGFHDSVAQTFDQESIQNATFDHLIQVNPVGVEWGTCGIDTDAWYRWMKHGKDRLHISDRRLDGFFSLRRGQCSDKLQDELRAHDQYRLVRSKGGTLITRKRYGTWRVVLVYIP